METVVYGCGVHFTTRGRRLSCARALRRALHSVPSERRVTSRKREPQPKDDSVM
jgi:hypothetical protein